LSRNRPPLGPSSGRVASQMVVATPCSTERAAPAHVGAHPARARGVDLDPAALELAREDPGQRVQARLGDPIGGKAGAHLAELAHAGGDVDHAATALHQRDQHLAEQERADQVGRQHRAQSGRARLEGAHRALARLVLAAHDPGVVDQDVEPAEFAADELREPRDAIVVRDVELMMAHVQAVTLQPRGRRRAVVRIAAGQDHARAAPAQLPAGLEAHAAIAPGDHRDPARRALLDRRHAPTALSFVSLARSISTAIQPRPPQSGQGGCSEDSPASTLGSICAVGRRPYDPDKRYARARNRSIPRTTRAKRWLP
jgi:hypothetical protein